jgi:hypothetical protein
MVWCQFWLSVCKRKIFALQLYLISQLSLWSPIPQNAVEIYFWSCFLVSLEVSIHTEGSPMHQFTFKQAEKSPNCVTMDTIMENRGTCLEFCACCFVGCFWVPSQSNWIRKFSRFSEIERGNSGLRALFLSTWSSFQLVWSLVQCKVLGMRVFYFQELLFSWKCGTNVGCLCHRQVWKVSHIIRTASNVSMVVAQSAPPIMQPLKGDFTANITILSSSRRLEITASSTIPQHWSQLVVMQAWISKIPNELQDHLSMADWTSLLGCFPSRFSTGRRDLSISRSFQMGFRRGLTPEVVRKVCSVFSHAV